MDSENLKISEHGVTEKDISSEFSLPKRFESPCKFCQTDVEAMFYHLNWLFFTDLFKGYGNQKDDLNPIYRTSNSDYGYYPPCPHTVPHK